LIILNCQSDSHGYCSWHLVQRTLPTHGGAAAREPRANLLARRSITPGLRTSGIGRLGKHRAHPALAVLKRGIEGTMMLNRRQTGSTA